VSNKDTYHLKETVEKLNK